MSAVAPSPELQPAEAGNPAPLHRTPSEPEVGEPNAVPSGSRAARTDNNQKHFFGLEQNAPRHEPIFMDDYEKRFSEDPYCEEMKPNARVYRVYVEEAAVFDATMVSQYRDGLDVMLVFAGLFSAVVTSFLVQVSQNLQADYAQMSALLLHDLVSIQLSDGVSVLNITTPSVDPAQKFLPDALDVWINGLWVVSLVAALVVALAAVLVKQWLHHYISLPSGTPMDRSHVRQFRFMGLERWRVRVIIGMLPLTMHVSLMLFLAGLVLFFIPLRVSLAWTIGIITVVVCIVYLISNALPILFPQCPYQTPLTDFLHYAHQISVSTFHHLSKRVVPLARRWLGLRYQPQWHRRKAAAGLKSLKTLETEVVKEAHPTLSVDALDWLFSMSSNPSVHSIVIQAIGGLSVKSEQHARMVWHEAPGLEMARQQFIVESTYQVRRWERECLPGSESRLERLCRSYAFIPATPFTHVLVHHIESNPRLAAVVLLGEVQAHLDQPDALQDFCLLYHATAMHPLVWQNLVTAGFFSPSANLHPRLLSLLLPGPLDVMAQLIWDASPMPLKAIVNTHLRSVVWDYFLNVLPGPAIHNGPGPPIVLPSEQQALLALGNHAVLNLDAEQSIWDGQRDWPYLDLLEQVFGGLVPHITEKRENRKARILVYVPTMLGKHCAFRNLLCTATDRVTVHWALRPDELRYRLNRCFSLLYSMYNSTQNSYKLTSSPSFRQLINHFVSKRTVGRSSLWNEVPDLYPPTAAIELALQNLDVDTLSIALSRGFEAAFHIFADDEWIKLLSPGWIVENIPSPKEIYRPVSCYISGLPLLPDDVRHEYLAHLCEHRNLTLAFITLSPDVAEVSRLVELDPIHSSWQQCRATLEALLTWTRDPVRESTDFPLDKDFGDPVGAELKEWCRLELRNVPFDLNIDVSAELRKCFNNDGTGAWLETILGILDEALVKANKETVGPRPGVVSPNETEACHNEPTQPSPLQ